MYCENIMYLLCISMILLFFHIDFYVVRILFGFLDHSLKLVWAVSYVRTHHLFFLFVSFFSIVSFCDWFLFFRSLTSLVRLSFSCIRFSRIHIPLGLQRFVVIYFCLYLLKNLKWKIELFFA